MGIGDEDPVWRVIDERAEVLFARTEALLNRGEVRVFSGHAIAGRSGLARVMWPQRPRHGIVVRDVRTRAAQAPCDWRHVEAFATNRCGVATGVIDHRR